MNTANPTWTKAPETSSYTHESGRIRVLKEGSDWTIQVLQGYRGWSMVRRRIRSLTLAKLWVEAATDVDALCRLVKHEMESIEGAYTKRLYLTSATVFPTIEHLASQIGGLPQ